MTREARWPSRVMKYGQYGRPAPSPNARPSPRTRSPRTTVHRSDLHPVSDTRHFEILSRESIISQPRRNRVSGMFVFREDTMVFAL